MHSFHTNKSVVQTIIIFKTFIFGGIMRKVLLLTCVLATLTSGCASLGQEFTIAQQLNSLKNNPAAQKYAAVTARAEKAYNKHNSKMAMNLINIVNAKIARNSNY
jgi:hypothetical protein